MRLSEIELVFPACFSRLVDQSFAANERFRRWQADRS
jgi:hypothetical protein